MQRVMPENPSNAYGLKAMHAMQQRARVLLFSMLLTVMFPLSLSALDIPELKGRVNDYAGMISEQTERLIDAELQTLEQEESTQIVVLTIPSLDGEVLEEFSMRVVESWKIGQKNLDNGALLLVSRDDRKLRIETGYGLEGRLTDLRSGRIIDIIIVPLFAQGRTDEGFLAGIDAMIAAVKGEYSAADAPPSGDDSGGSLFPVLIILLLIFYYYRQVPRNGRGSGPVIFGGGPGGFSGGSFGGGGFSSGGFSGGGGGFGGGGSSGSW